MKVLIVFFALFAAFGLRIYSIRVQKPGDDFVTLERLMDDAPIFARAEASRAKTIVLSGSSEVSGMPYPAGTRVSDYLNAVLPEYRVLNFGLVSADIFQIFYSLKYLQPPNSNRIIVGLSEGDFATRPKLGHLSLKTRERLAGAVKDELETYNMNSSKLKTAFEEPFFDNTYFRHELYDYDNTVFEIRLESLLVDARRFLYGPAWNANGPAKRRPDFEPEYFKILELIRKLAGQRGETLTIYLSPLNDPEKPVTGGEPADFKTAILNYGKATNMEIHDLSEAVPAGSVYFFDNLHTTAEGNKILAEAIGKIQP